MATGRAKYLTRIGWQDALFAMFLLWLTISAVTNAQSGVEMHRIFMYWKWFVLYKLVAASLARKGELRRAGMVIVLFALVMAVESIQHMHSPGQLGWAGQSLGWIDQGAVEAGVIGRTRWVGIFDGPGVFCVIFTLALPFLLRFLDRAYPAFKRATAAVLLAPLMLAIYYTGSRGGFLATLAILGMHFGARTKISLTKLAVVGVLLVAVFATAPAYMISMYDQNRSAQHRVDVWMDGLSMVRENPVFGVGLGHYADYTGTLIAHNSSMEIMGETGIPGVFLWLSLLYLGFKQLWLYWRQTEDPLDRSYAKALGISLAGYVISAMFVTLEYETYYFMLGMTAAVGLQLEEPVPYGWRDRILVLATVGGFLVLMRAFTGLYY